MNKKELKAFKKKLKLKKKAGKYFTKSSPLARELKDILKQLITVAFYFKLCPRSRKPCGRAPGSLK